MGTQVQYVSKSRKSGIDWSYVIYHCTNQSIYSWYTSHFGMESGSSISSFSKQRGKAETSYRMAKCAATSDCDPLPGGIFCRRISLDISQRNEGSYRRGSHHSPGPTFFILRCLACSISRLNNGSSKIRSGIGALFWKMLKYVIVKLCRSIFFVMGFHWVKVKGQQEPSSEAPVVCIAPHSSLFDAIVLCVGTELSGVVSAVDHTNIPFIGKLIQFTQPVFVSREDPNSRINTIKEIKKRAHSKGAWPQVVIFPEGTCTNRSCLIGFKPGGFYPGVPVQPVCVRYPNKLDTITWTWDGPEAFKVLWYTLCQFHNYVEIEFLPVHVPNEDEIKDARLFAENVRRRMAVCLDCAVTDHSYDDCRLMLRAAKLNIPASKGIIELHKMHKSLGVSFDAMKDLLEKCHSQVLNQSIDIVTLEEFADYLDIPKSENLQKLFNFYDQVGSDKIDFREYVVSLCLVSGPASVDDTVRMTFQLFEHRQDGFVTSQDLMCIFKHMFRMTKDETQQLFLAVDSDKDGQITYDELRHFARNQPECKKLYSAYQDHCNGLPNLCALDDNFLGSKYE